MIFYRIARIAVNQLLELPSSLEMEEPEPSIHRARNIYKCPVCAKTVKSQNYLRLHMKSHTGKQFTQNNYQGNSTQVNDSPKIPVSRIEILAN